MKTKASVSHACEPLVAVRRYTNPNGLTPGERVLLDALIDHGGVTKAARALGLDPKSTASRMRVVREKLSAANSAEAIALWVARRDAA